MFKHKGHKHHTVDEARECEAHNALSLPDAVNKAPLHEEPCRCSPYDRCWGVRVQDAKGATTHNEALRRLHRAYND